MIKLYNNGVFLVNQTKIIENDNNAELLLAKEGKSITKEQAAKNTIAYSIIKKHNSGTETALKIKFDALASHDITYVGIIQTARASGLTHFPIPYVLTNCHNSLCAVGGTINEDDHRFGLSAAKKYGGIYVPAHQAVIHQYMREMQAGCGKMILGSDSHTRYGAIGTMAIGEGGPELVKQLLNKTYDINYPEVIGVYLTGKPSDGVGPQDIALSIIGKVFANGYVKNKVMEFVGDGIANLSMEYRNGIDVMTTETTCLSSIWKTDDKTRQYLQAHGRENEYKELAPLDVSYYDGMVYVDMSEIKPSIAMPFHPSNVYEIAYLNENLSDILREVEKKANEHIDNKNLHLKLTDKIENGRLRVDQGVIAGCAGGTFENIVAAADILGGNKIGNDEFALSIYPSSQPTFVSLVENGKIASLMMSGATIRTAFCGPCFGAGDVPFNQALSIRHSTRNFENREGSKPGNNQIASVALMDARSIAATAKNGGLLTGADELLTSYTTPLYTFNKEIYENRCLNNALKPDATAELKFGPNITDWPKMSQLTDDILLKVAAVLLDDVTTTDELIPSGETSSYRSNPEKLSEFTLSRKDPQYVQRAKDIRKAERARLNGADPIVEVPALKEIFDKIEKAFGKKDPLKTGIGSVIYAKKPGDGSAREQAASCQKVLGGLANIANEYATKRYRSNLINWGMLPFITMSETEFSVGDYIFIPDIKKAVTEKQDKIKAYIIGDENKEITLTLNQLTDDEREIILKGCLINYYKG